MTSATSSTFAFRRPTAEDLPQLQNLSLLNSSENDLLAQFGNHDINQVIKSPICILGTISNGDSKSSGNPIGLLSLCNGPPDHAFPSAKDPTDWDMWIKSSFECKSVTLHNTKFLSYFVAEKGFSHIFLEAALKFLFNWIPNLKFIGYLLNETVAIFPPLSLSKLHKPKSPTLAIEGALLEKDTKYFYNAAIKDITFNYALLLCSKKDLVPVLKIRKSKVEDCDDLIPMLKKQNIISGPNAEFFLSVILDSNSETKKTLIAEADGRVVGFLSINTQVEHDKLDDIFDTSAFNYLRRDPSMGNSDHPTTFCIDLFCIEDEYANNAYDLVRAAFQILPYFDYCLMSVAPSLQEHPLWRDFIQINTNPGKIANQVMYLSNRYGDSIHLRKSNSEDIHNVSEFESDLENMGCEEDIIASITNTLTEKNENSILFFIQQGRQNVGAAVLEKCTISRQLIDQFEISEFIEVKNPTFLDKHIVLKHLVLNPLFQHQSRWVMQELLRIQKIPILLFYHSDATAFDLISKTCVIREMVPVKIRRLIQFPDNLRDGVLVPPPLELSLQIISVPLLYQPKITINTRIVVLGASDVGLSYLENLVYKSHLYFTNLFLVSENEFNASTSSDFVGHRCYDSLKLKQLGLEHYVKIINSSVTGIDRVSKNIKLVDQTILGYDFLILACGMQFYSSSVHSNFSSLGSVYSFNLTEIERIKNDCKTFPKSEESAVCVIYGKSIQAYSAIQMLIREGVPSSKIILINPQGHSSKSCFKNTTIFQKVSESLDDLDVKVHCGYKIFKWGENENKLESLVFKSSLDEPLLKVDGIKLFIYADEKSVNPDSFKAINDSCLVFDGHLVIDKYFRTQDSYIFGAGSITKYSSKYQTKWSPSSYDSKEVGVRLSEIMMQLFDPSVEPEELDVSNLLLDFFEPKKIEAHLPGNLYYFHIDKPRLESQTKEILQMSPFYGRDMIFETPDVGYIRIHIDIEGYVRSITYLGTPNIPINNYESLFGIHEKYLNRMIARFDEGVITDIVGFLRETWALPLFHDRFKIFSKKLINSISLEYFEDDALTAKLNEHINNGTDMNQEEKDELYKSFDKSPKRKELDDKVFEYMNECGIFESFPCMSSFRFGFLHFNKKMRVLDKINKPLILRPKKTIDATPCAIELTTMFNCWRSIGVDSGECASTATALMDCMKKTTVVKKKAKGTEEINYWLHKVRTGKMI